MKKRVEPFGFFQGSYSVGHMRMSKIVDFKVALIKKLKSIICSSEGYLEPGRITMMKVLAVKFCKKALSEMFDWILNTSSCRSFFNRIIPDICVCLFLNSAQ